MIDGCLENVGPAPLVDPGGWFYSLVGVGPVDLPSGQPPAKKYRTKDVASAASIRPPKDSHVRHTKNLLPAIWQSLCFIATANVAFTEDNKMNFRAIRFERVGLHGT